MTFSTSSHIENGNSSIPEVLSLPTSTLILSMDKLTMSTENEEIGNASSDLPSVSSYNSLSSLSSCGNFSEVSVRSEESTSSTRQRSIFKSYWKNTGSTPSITRTGKSSPSVATPATASVSSWDSDDESTAANSYERVLKRNEGVKSSSRRRSIFGSTKYDSMPSLLARPYHPAPLERKIKSTSALSTERLPSCLRSSEREEGSKRCSSVSFDCEVSVITYTCPKENWAAEGWSKMFH